MSKKIVVLGAGLVGGAMAIDMAKDHEVTSVDINAEALAAYRIKESKLLLLMSPVSSNCKRSSKISI